MNEQRERSRSGNRRRRRKKKSKSQPQASPEPVMIAARRPNSPVLSAVGKKTRVAASAKPRTQYDAPLEVAKLEEQTPKAVPPPRRTARIVAVNGAPLDEREQMRRRLLQRMLDSDGRSAITRAAKAYAEAGFEFPLEQEVQLQLLEHIDEERAREAIGALSVLIQRGPLIKRPLVEQRLRRLEEYADEPPTREAAAQLRRAIR